MPPTIPAHWLTLMAVLRAHPSYSVTTWFNPNASPQPGFAALVMDGHGYAPPIEEGAVWSAFASDPVRALDNLARVVHKANP